MELIPVTTEHIEFLCDNLKPDHQRELAWFGAGNRRGVRTAIDVCDGHALSAVHHGKLLFIAGVQQTESLYGDAAAITYLAANEFDAHITKALRLTRELFDVEAWKHTDKTRIEQYLPPPYTTGIRFLEKLLGWTVGGIVMFGARQAVHMYYEREK